MKKKSEWGFVAFIVLLGFVGFAAGLLANTVQASVSEVPTHTTKYVCIKESIVYPGSDSKSVARDACEVIAMASPGVETYLVQSSTILSIAEPEKVWVVKLPSIISRLRGVEDRAIYDCGPACVTDRKRGSEIARSQLSLAGRCEGPLSPVWGTTNNQWQFHTNSDGIRGLSYCTLTDEPLPPITPPVEPPEPIIEWLASSVGGSPVTIPSNEYMTAENALWEIEYDLLGEPSGNLGLISRDQTGQAQAGHLDVYIDSDGFINVRMQGLNSGLVILKSTVKAVNGFNRVGIKRTPDLVTLYLNGFEQDSTTEVYPTNGNDLPLVIGASCQSCTGQAVGTKWSAPMDVTVRITLENEPESPVDPEPPGLPLVYEATARWSAPTEWTDGTPIAAGTVISYKAYYGTTSGVYDRTIEMGNNTNMKKFDLEVGFTYYLVATATIDGKESSYTNEIEFTPPSE